MKLVTYSFPGRDDTDDIFSVGSGLRRQSPLLPSLRDDLVTCRRVDLVTCPHAALARLPRGL